MDKHIVGGKVFHKKFLTEIYLDPDQLISRPTDQHTQWFFMHSYNNPHSILFESKIFVSEGQRL